MRPALSVAFTLALAFALTGCSRHAEDPASPGSASTNAAAAPPPAIADGTPHLALAPDNVHIDYRVYGRGEPLIVLIHGWSCDANYWRAQIDDLRESYTVVAVNLAGHGASGRNRSHWTIQAFGADVAAVLKALPQGKVILVGHSMGGAVALEAARRIPGRLLGIIGVDAFADLGAAPRSDPQADRLIARLEADYIGATREFVSTRLFPKNADPALVRRTADDMALAPPEVAIPSLIALLAYDTRPALAEIRVPIVDIRSDMWPFDENRIRSVVPGFRARVLPGRGHFPMLEDPAGFGSILREEIASLSGGTG